MKSDLVKALSSKIILALSLIMPVAAFSQASWNVKLISPGTYEVNIKPAIIMENVDVLLILQSDNNEKQETKPFTNSKVLYLQPGNVYAKRFTCDNSIKKVTGKYIYYGGSGGGDKADGSKPRIEVQSGSNTNNPNAIKVIDDDDRTDPSATRSTLSLLGWQEIGGTTDVALAVSEHNNTLYLFSKGANDHGIYVNINTSRNNLNSWKGWQLIPGMKTNVSLSSVIFNGEIYLFAKGENNHSYYNHSLLNQNGSLNWSGWQEVSGNGTTNASLSATAYRGALYLFAKGINDGKVYYNILKRSLNWTGWRLINGTFSTSTAVSSHIGIAGKLWVLAENATNHQTYYNILDTSMQWSGWRPSPSGGAGNRPPVMTGTSSTLYFFTTNTNNRIHCNLLSYIPEFRWSGWQELENGASNVNVAAIGGGNSRVIIFLKAINGRIFVTRQQ